MCLNKLSQPELPQKLMGNWFKTYLSLTMKGRNEISVEDTFSKCCLFITVSMSKLRNPKCLHKLFAQRNSVGYIQISFQLRRTMTVIKLSRVRRPRRSEGGGGTVWTGASEPCPGIWSGAGTSARDFVSPVATGPPPPPRVLPTTV